MRNKHTMEMIFPELLLVIFSLCSLFLLTAGVYSYQKFNQQNDSDVTTALTYMKTKVESNNLKDSISITTIDNIDCLTIENTIEDKNYKTYIYVYNEKLQELWIPETEAPHLIDGTPILDMKTLSLSIHDNNLVIEVTDNNDLHKQLTLYINGGVLK